MAKTRRNFAKHVSATCGRVATPEQTISEKLASSLLGLQRNEEPYYTMREAREIRRRREEDAIRHSESEDDPDETEDDNVIL